MQRAASSDTLSTIALSNTDARNSASLHDVKQQLSHSQSMILPENGKVFSATAGAHIHKHKLMRGGNAEQTFYNRKQSLIHIHMHTWKLMSSSCFAAGPAVQRLLL